MDILTQPTTERLSLGFNFQRDGDFQRAESFYRDVLAADPLNPDALYLLGFLCHQLGKEEEALAHLQEAAAQRPQEALFSKTLGDVYLALGEDERARQLFVRALSVEPSSLESCIALGHLEARQKKPEEAVRWFRRGIEIDVSSPDAYLGLGCALRDLENYDGAERCLKIAVSLKPQASEALAALGEVEMKRQQFAEAEALFRQSLSLRPGIPGVLNNLGSALKELGRPTDAIPVFLEAYRLNPAEPAVPFNLGGTWSALGNMDEAIRWYDIATEAHPDYAEAHANKAILLLSAGDFARGWEEYEWRFRIRDKRQKIDTRTFPVPQWRGEALEGKTLLVRSEQGAGDMIQFCRYLPLLKALGGRILFETAPRLARLFRNVEGADAIVPTSKTPETTFDLYVPLLSVPRYFTPDVGAIPARRKYLAAEPELMAATADLIPPEGLTVGISWQGNPEFVGDRSRSLALREFESLLRLPGVRFYSLQKGFGVEQLADLPPGLEVQDLGSHLDEHGDAFVETAAVVTHLDLVISTDTALPHLAAALGRPTWLLLDAHPEWRWCPGDERTPWYPTMRLFRRSDHESWNEVLRRVSAALLTETLREDHRSTNATRERSHGTVAQ
jgi:tetratricopeptide (TPR) repeat protein